MLLLLRTDHGARHMMVKGRDYLANCNDLMMRMQAWANQSSTWMGSRYFAPRDTPVL